MATKKKPAAKGVKKAVAAKRPGASRSRSSTAQRSAAAELRVATKTVELQVVCFTVLSVIFAVMAFWRYGWQ